MRRGRGGFTLLEIAVAMSILAIGVVTLQQIYQGALHLQNRALRQSRAVLHARAAMDALLLDKSLEDTQYDLPATREGFRTHVVVRHATSEEGAPEDSDESDSSQSLRYIEVRVDWNDGLGSKTYTLRSLRMAPEDEE